MTKPRVTLKWQWDVSDSTWEASVPAKDFRGTGLFHLFLVQRPQHCDRGRWLAQVASEVVADLDGQEGFLRYYFKLENAKEEMELWANERQEVKAAFYHDKQKAI